MKRLLFIVLVAALALNTFAGKSLSREQAEKCRQELLQKWMKTAKERSRKAWESRTIETDGISMPYWLAVYGEQPADGRSLWISMHGGGNAPKKLNDQQWENQKYLYRPAEGVYVAPRAPYDDWDMWFKRSLDSCCHKLIEACVAYAGVNPDKVYLLGYSAGGDGVWRMAPRMADTWAAASMMAGHPGNVSTLNLRNLPFMIWCGAEDAAYDRNLQNRGRGRELDSLQAATPDGYVHETHIVEGMGHWMNRADTLAVSWMARYVRNPYPRNIVWRQEEVVRSHFYWLTAPTNELQQGKTVRITCCDNVIDIEQCDYSALTLWLNDELANLDLPITVRHCGKVIFKGNVKRTEANLRQSLELRNDPSYAFPACVQLLVPAPHSKN